VDARQVVLDVPRHAFADGSAGVLGRTRADALRQIPHARVKLALRCRDGVLNGLPDEGHLPGDIRGRACELVARERDGSGDALLSRALTSSVACPGHGGRELVEGSVGDAADRSAERAANRSSAEPVF
jgi:hypothetical protein